MGHGSRGSWVSSLMGQMGHESQNCQLWIEVPLPREEDAREYPALTRVYEWISCWNSGVK